MFEYLFVYGSLLQNFSSGMATLLRQHSEFLGWASIPGVLYDLGFYPGAVFEIGSSHTISGQVLQLSQAAFILPILDRYEEISSPPALTDEYTRQLVPVQIGNRQLECWVYLYQLPVEGLPVIPDGDYLKYMKDNRQHLDFLDSV